MWDELKKMKKLIAGLLLALLLAGGQAFASNITGTVGGDATGGTLQVDVNATANITLQERAYNMLVILGEVANYTESLINSSSTVDNETRDLYAQAENLRESAWAAYDAGNYSAAITIAMSAMETYELVVERMVPSGGMPPANSTNMKGQALYWAGVEIQRAKEYLAYAAEIIDEASKLGIDTAEASKLYSQTAEAYSKVEDDIKKGDINSLRDDMRTAENLRMQLEMAVERLVRSILSASAGDIAEAFTKKLEAELNRTAELMALMESVIGNSSVNDPRASMMMRMLEMRRMDIQNMLAMVQRLIDAGRYEMALRMVKEINSELEESIVEIQGIAMEFHDGYMMNYCSQYANTTTQPMNPDYHKYCNQSWWKQWERGMGNMMGTGWWNEETDHMGAGMGMGMGNIGRWNGPWWSDSEHEMNQGTPGNGSMGGGWMNHEDNYWWNGADHDTPYDDWSGSWTMNQTNTTGGNTMEDGQGSNAGSNMDNTIGNGQNNDQDNHMEDPNDGSNDNWGNDPGNNGSNDDHEDSDGNSGGCGNCGGNWGSWWGG